MLRKTSTRAQLCTLMLDEILPFVRRLPVVTERAAPAGDTPAFAPNVYECGANRCLLGWAVQWPEFQPYINRGPDGDIYWPATRCAVLRALGRPHDDYLFSDEHVSLDEREAMVREALERALAEGDDVR